MRRKNGTKKKQHYVHHVSVKASDDDGDGDDGVKICRNSRVWEMVVVVVDMDQNRIFIYSSSLQS